MHGLYSISNSFIFMSKLEKIFYLISVRHLISSRYGVEEFGYKNRMLKLHSETYYLNEKESIIFRYLRLKKKLFYRLYKQVIYSPHSGKNIFFINLYTLK